MPANTTVRESIATPTRSFALFVGSMTRYFVRNFLFLMRLTTELGPSSPALAANEISGL